MPAGRDSARDTHGHSAHPKQDACLPHRPSRIHRGPQTTIRTADSDIYIKDSPATPESPGSPVPKSSRRANHNTGTVYTPSIGPRIEVSPPRSEQAQSHRGGNHGHSGHSGSDSRRSQWSAADAGYFRDMARTAGFDPDAPSQAGRERQATATKARRNAFSLTEGSRRTDGRHPSSMPR